MRVAIRLTGVLCAVAMVAAISAFTTADPAPQKPMAGNPPVKIDNFSFTPNVLTVPVGTSVQWVNRDDIPHTVVSDDKTTFKSKALDTDDNFKFTFSKPGTYAYFCSIHPKMTGKIIVE